jgi:hypothetical protein
MRRRGWLAITLLSISSSCLAGGGLTGCLGLAGNFELVSDAGDASFVDVAQDDVRADVRRETGSEKDAPVCTSGGACDAGPCTNGQYVCVNGEPSCEKQGMVTNGTACTFAPTPDAGDAGSDADDADALASDANDPDAASPPLEVCFEGMCGLCYPGVDCSDPGSCQKKTTDCGSGTSVCTADGNKPDGTKVVEDGGIPLYCSQGKPSPCMVAMDCTPPDASCDKGQVTACTAGLETCTASMPLTPVANGTSCGNSYVCDQGACVPCSANVECTPTNPCHVGMTSCATGTSVCVDINTPRTDNSPCTETNESECFKTYSCQAGTCTPSNPVVCPSPTGCQGAGVCNPTTGLCTYSSGKCLTATGCQGAGTCNTITGECTYAAAACPAHTGCQGTGTCNTSTGACTYSAGTCASAGCQTDGVCNPNTGTCKFTAGTCTPAGCQTDGVCDTTNGDCTYGAKACQTTGCQIDGACNTSNGDCTYAAGACATTGCQAVGTCNTSNGDCTYTAKACATTGCQVGTCTASTGACTYTAGTCKVTGCQAGGTCTASTGACTYTAGTCKVTGCQVGTCTASTGACTYTAGTCKVTGCQVGTCTASTGACTYAEGTCAVTGCIPRGRAPRRLSGAKRVRSAPRPPGLALHSWATRAKRRRSASA